MDKSNNLIIKDINSENITIMNNLDLNSLFNLTYNFDLLKGIITTLFTNQQSLQKQINDIKNENDEQKKSIQSLKSNLKEKYLTKEQFKPLKYNMEITNNKINDKINKFEEILTKSKYIIIYKKI